MAISLSKGERINLSKEAPGLNNTGIGLGWDVNATDTGSVFDLDGSVKSLGDSKTGEGAGDDETVQINLSLVDSSVQEIVFVVTIHEADVRKHNFGQVKNSFIKIYDNATKSQIAKYELEEDFSTETAIEFGKLYKKDGNWRFQAVGQGYKAGLQKFVEQYSFILSLFVIRKT